MPFRIQVWQIYPGSTTRAGGWVDLHPLGGGTPYEWATREEAEKQFPICCPGYPQAPRRIVKVAPAWWRNINALPLTAGRSLAERLRRIARSAGAFPL